MKKLFLVLSSTILFTFSATAADMRIALVVKGLGIGFFEAAAEGGEEAAKEIELAGGNISKPIKLRKARDGVRYELVEGRIKFWGWMILFSMTRPIPAIIIQ